MKKIISITLTLLIIISCFPLFSEAPIGVDEKKENKDDLIDSRDSVEEKTKKIKTIDNKNIENKGVDEKNPKEALSVPKDALMIDKIKGGKKMYNTANIVLNGELVSSDVPAILYNLNGEVRTLVPIRVISEKLGADVKWEQDDMRVKIFYKGDVISLVIEDSKAVVNGTEKPLPNGVPAKLMSYIDIQRTLVPIRFISETYGHRVAWEGDTRTVYIDSTDKPVSVTPHKPSQSLISLKVDDKNNPKQVELEFSDDFKEEWVEDFIPKDSSKGIDRLVFDFNDVVLEKTENIKNIYDEKNHQVRLNLNKDDMKAVRLAQFNNSPYVTRLVIDMVGNHKYKTSKKGNKFSIEFTGEVEETKKIENLAEESSEIKNKPDPKFKDYFSYVLVKTQEFSVIKINPDTFESINIEKKPDGSVDIKFSGNSFKLNQFDWLINDEFIKSVSSVKKDGEFTINVIPTEGTSVYENPNTIDKTNHEIVFERGKDLRVVPENKKLVVLDPGHGGSDVGAKSTVDGTTELSIIENMTPLVKAELEKLGYFVLLTRDSDIDLGLYPRTKYAELAGASVLVSIHANAFSAERAHGIETFKKTGRAKSELLAFEILKYMVEFSRMLDKEVINRGVKDDDLYITRMSHAPSTLLELGFITNTRELSNLKNPVYVKNMALAIAKGVHSYFSKEQ